jgi:hypothetical protein
VTRLAPQDLANQKGGAEAPDASSLTTVKEYSYVASSKLPEVKGTSAYEPMADNTVRMALNVWAGWAPVIFANNGFKAGKVWKSPSGKTFKLELVLIDDPIAMRDAYASGKVHLGWATLDMVPLFVEQLRKDSRTMPRIYQQIDWSNGGDGIVCRQAVKVGVRSPRQDRSCSRRIRRRTSSCSTRDQRRAATGGRTVQVHAGRLSGCCGVQRGQGRWRAP